MPDDHGGREPPESIPNSVVKPSSADGSVALAHARVGRCQASTPKAPLRTQRGFFYGHIILLQARAPCVAFVAFAPMTVQDDSLLLREAAILLSGHDKVPIEGINYCGYVACVLFAGGFRELWQTASK